MGGKSTTTASTNSTSAPWAPAQPALNGLLDQIGTQVGNTSLTPTETGAFGQLTNNANQGNPFSGQLTSAANNVFSAGGQAGGIANDAYSTLQKQLSPTANGQFVDPNTNPFYSGVTGTLTNDITNQVNGMFAGAGRDLSGANIGALSRGITQGVAPIFAQQYNTERQNQLNAASSLYGAGNTTAGLLPNLASQTAQSGAAASDAANTAQNYGPNMLLQIAAQQRGIPLSMLQSLTGMASGIGGLGNQTSGTQTGTSQPSTLQEILMATQAWKNMMPSGGGGAPPVMPG